MVVTIVLVVVGVLAFWLVAAVALALFIGRAARIGEIKHRDAVFLRDMAADQARSEQLR
jgi:hypothetical protein